MDLPRALWPWRQPLSIFPHDLAISLGGMVDKLALLVGPMVSPEKVGRGEPDGLNGIGRRGSFERLLATEWALAEEAPLEFLRRVSTGELSFLEIAHQKPTIARQSVALFDVGPDAFGAPKIVHLAALILLAQRAYDGGARFSWGVLQDPSGELLADVNEESVRKLLKAGSNRPMVIDDASRFCETLQEDDAEVWFVGSPSTSRVISDISPHRIEIEDSFDPDAPFELDVTVCSERQKPRSVRLELPPTATSVRLLRDPFQLARVRPTKTESTVCPESNILFCRTNRKLFLRGSENELLTIPIPNSPNASELPKPRVFRPPPDQRLLGVGRQKPQNTTIAVTRAGDSLALHYLSKRGCTSMRDETFRIEPDGALSGVDLERGELGTLFANDLQRMYFHHQKKRLFSFERSSQIALMYSTVVSAAHQEDLTLVSVQVGNPALIVKRGPSGLVEVPFGTAMMTQTIFGPAGNFATTYGHNYLLMDSEGQMLHPEDHIWFFTSSEGKLFHKVPIAKTNAVLGVVDATKPSYVFMDASRTRISFVEQERIETWVTSPVPMRTAAANVGAWLVAFITEENELCVYSRDHKTLVLRMRLGAA